MATGKQPASKKPRQLTREESIRSLKEEPQFVMGPPVESILKNEEKRYLLLVERGDYNGVRSLLNEYKDKPEELNINCTDPLGRTSLVIAIENESFELIEVLLESGIEVSDALLHAISEDYVEAVELLLEWEEKHHKEGDPYSWEKLDNENATFTPDITPLILAAHRNNYEILKLLLDRGAALPMPHDVRCGCDECVTSSSQDSLRHSRSRINAYRALASPSLIALSSKDPILTAFELSKELGRLSIIEAEFTTEYRQLKEQCQTFATSLLDHVRTSYELETLLNYSNDTDEIWEQGDRQTLERLELAIKYTQKDFVAHPNVQQLLGTIWYQGLPGFRRRSMLGQLAQTMSIAIQFPIHSLMYMLAPGSARGAFVKLPFVKFICHSASYLFFLSLLGLASQRVEYVLIEWFGNEWMMEVLEDWKRRERGALPGPIELLIMLYVFGHIWAEVKALWRDGLLEYMTDLWNMVDFACNMFFTAWIFMRVTAFYIVKREEWDGGNPYYPREEWHPFDPMLLSEGMFGAAMIFSYLKMVHVFSISPHLGPLQISLGRIVIDIIKFFFIYMLVLVAFGCGLNQLMWYYADLEKKKCYSLPGGLPDWENEQDACFIWRRFANLFETSQSLFWASFGLVDLQSFDLTGIKGFTRFWGMLMFGSYSMINIIVLLNMLIAMMSTSYAQIAERADTEWKYARSRLWLSYFDEGATVPPPFNLMPTPKSALKPCTKKTKKEEDLEKMRHAADIRHMEVMRLLVRRYVTAEQKKSEEMEVTEDDVNEIKQDISSFRFELLDILKNNGMKTGQIKHDNNAAGKKGRLRERRLMKGFQIGMVEDLLQSVIASSIGEKGPVDVFGKLAKAMTKRTSSKLKRAEWNEKVASRVSIKRNPIGTKDNSVRRWSQQSLRRSVIESERAALLSMDPDRIIEYNPRLKEYTPATRVAYAKFKAKTLGPISENKGEFEDKSPKTGSKASLTNVVVNEPLIINDGKPGASPRASTSKQPPSPSSQKVAPATCASDTSTTSAVSTTSTITPQPPSTNTAMMKPVSPKPGSSAATTSSAAPTTQSKVVTTSTMTPSVTTPVTLATTISPSAVVGSSKSSPAPTATVTQTAITPSVAAKPVAPVTSALQSPSISTPVLKPIPAPVITASQTTTSTVSAAPQITPIPVTTTAQISPQQAISASKPTTVTTAAGSVTGSTAPIPTVSGTVASSAEKPPASASSTTTIPAATTSTTKTTAALAPPKPSGTESETAGGATRPAPARSPSPKPVSRPTTLRDGWF